MMHISHKAVAVVALTAASLSVAEAAIVSFPYENTISYWGPSANQEYGEIFHAPQSHLIDYSFILSGTQPFSFVSQVFAWSGTSTLGSALFTSSLQTIGTSNAVYNFVADIDVVSGNQYIALVTHQPNGQSLGGNGYANMGHSLVPSSNGDGFAFRDLNNNWACQDGCGHAAFTANFSDGRSSVPEPGTLALLAIGLVGLGCSRRRQ